MHFFIRNLMGKNPGKIRLIHRHYPMDHQYNPLVKDPFHTGAGKLALLAIYAAEKNKFWELSDLLFEAASQKGEINIKTLAQKIGLDSRDLVKALFDRKTRIHLNADIQSGLRLGVSGTPAYVVNQQLYLGQLPAEVLEQVMK
jgi:protein-disulfide isomerase